MKNKVRGKPFKKSSFSKKVNPQSKQKSIGKNPRDRKGRPSKVGKARVFSKDQKNRSPRFKGIFNTSKEVVTHKQQRMNSKQQKKQAEKVCKIIIQEQLKKDSPNIEKIKQNLSKIKSRGIKQRIKSKLPGSWNL